MKTRYIWEASDIIPGKQFKDWNGSLRTIVATNFNDCRGRVYNIYVDGWVLHSKWMTTDELVIYINAAEGVPL